MFPEMWQNLAQEKKGKVIICLRSRLILQIVSHWPKDTVKNLTHKLTTEANLQMTLINTP